MGLLKGIFRTMFPWVLYAILVGELNMPAKYALLIGMSFTIIISYKFLLKKYIISWITLVCFIGLFIHSFTASNLYVEKDPWVVSNLILTIIAIGSVLLKKPFTMQYARELVSEEKLKHPLFLKINVTLSLFWGMIFLICFLCHVVIIFREDLHVYLRFFIYGLTILGVFFTAKYPTFARERYRKLNARY